MLFRRHTPCKPLCEFIEDFWLYENYDAQHPRERILPSGTVEMVFNLQEDELRIYGPADVKQCRRFSGGVVSGPYVGSFMSDAAEETSIMGVHFRPGGAAAVLGMPIDTLLNTHHDLSAIWGRAAITLREQLCGLRRPDDRFELLERHLLERYFTFSQRPHHAVRLGLDILTRTHGIARIQDVAKAAELSQRRFAELFADEVGLTPKLFGRIQRFQHAVAQLKTSEAVDWAQFAVECGYFDQSHMIHEFAELSGVRPFDYLRRRKQLESAETHLKRHHLPWSV